MIGSGANILDVVSKTILTNGDQQFNGSLRLIEPSTNQTVIAMDINEKQVVIQYPVGLGTENPRSALTIEDVSITNFISYLDELSKKYRYVTDLQKQLSASTPNNFATIIENYINPFTNLPFTQNVDNYFHAFLIDKLDYSTARSVKYIYHWYLPQFVGYTVGELLDNPNIDPVNNTLKVLSFTGLTKSIETGFMEENYVSLNIYNWTWGKKIRISNYFSNNDNLYYISMGVNFNQYFTRYNTNKNLQTLIEAIQFFQLYNIIYI